MLVLFSVIGAGALWLTFTWLAAAIVASQFSAQKGYGEKPGLVTGAMLTFMGAFAWAVWPAREVSRWNVHKGLTGKEKGALVAVVGIVAVVGAYLVATLDASTAGRIALIVVVIMFIVIAAAIVKSVSIAQATGGKTMSELRAERDRAGAIEA
jgi:hypothetical protein